MFTVALLSYCSLLKPALTQTQVSRILSFERRPKEITREVMGEVDDPFENYFEFLNTLPKLKLECGCRSPKYLGAKIFNDLPTEVRKHCKEKNFHSISSNHFLG